MLSSISGSNITFTEYWLDIVAALLMNDDVQSCTCFVLKILMVKGFEMKLFPIIFQPYGSQKYG